MPFGLGSPLAPDLSAATSQVPGLQAVSPVWLCSCSLFKGVGTTWSLITSWPWYIICDCLALSLLLIPRICLGQNSGLGFTGRRGVLQGSGHQARPCDAFSGHQPGAMICSFLLLAYVLDYLALDDLSVSLQIMHQGMDSWGLWLYTHPHTMGTSCCLWASSVA